MKRIALIEFHFDFFIPLVDYFEQDGLKISLWTSHRKTLQGLPERIFGYRSRYAQIGITPSGERVSGSPDGEIARALWARQEMLLNQAGRFRVFLKWDRDALWQHILAMADYWDNLLRSQEIDIVLYKTEPHMLFDSILFLAAGIRGRINLFFERLPFDSRVMVCESLDDMRGEIRGRLASVARDHGKGHRVAHPATSGNNNTHLEIPFHYKFKRDRARKSRFKNIGTRLRKVWRFEEWSGYFRGKARHLARHKELWGLMGADIRKPRKQSWPVFIVGAIVRRVIYSYTYRYAFALCNYLLFRGSFEQGGLLFCLQCQPERSTNPCGGPEYFDQIRLITDISSIIGPDRRLFVKEHPSQFSSYQLPEVGRSLRFYYDLVKLKNVVLLPSLPTAEELIGRAGCVISVGGSACWGALKKGVPAIVCGQVGYAACDGAMPGRNREEIREAIEKLDHITPPDRAIAAAAAAYESECKNISEKAYLDRIYEQKFDAQYDNARVLCRLVDDFLSRRASGGPSAG
jgi:hypothetical protein